jgi:hypothetical protein
MRWLVFTKPFYQSTFYHNVFLKEKPDRATNQQGGRWKRKILHQQQQWA